MEGSAYLAVALILLVAAGLVLLWAAPKLKSRLARRRELRQRALLEDVLKHVFTQQQEGRKATIDSVAGHLEIPEATALRLAIRMEAAGLLHTATGGLQLTEEGERWALQVVRAHRLWETYLADEACMPVSKLHDTAEREEHKLTANQRVDELDAHLGHPRSDPHGDPIPTAYGELPAVLGESLATWPLGRPAQIVHVEDEPKAVFRRIASEGLRPGAVVQVMRQTQEHLTLTDGAKQIDLPPLVADNIHVAPVSEVPAEARILLRLSDLAPGQNAEVVLLDRELRGFARRRLLDLGLTPKAKVAVHLTNAFGDPLAFRVRGTTIALRKEQASKVWVRRLATAQAQSQAPKERPA